MATLQPSGPELVNVGDFPRQRGISPVFRWFNDAVKVSRTIHAMTRRPSHQAAPDARMVLMKGLRRAGLRVLQPHRQRQGGLSPTRRRGVLLETAAAVASGHRRGNAGRGRRLATRARQAQLGAGPANGEPLESRFALTGDHQGAASTLSAVPRPPGWERLAHAPLAIEFWHDRPFRLHDRIVFRRASLDAAWSKTRHIKCLSIPPNAAPDRRA